MATTPKYAWPIPDLGNPPNGPLNLDQLAEAAENTLASKALTTYTPIVRTTGVPPGNFQQLIGRYKQLGPWCWVYIWVLVGSGDPNAFGTGEISFDLPMPHIAENTAVQPSEGLIPGKVYYPGGGTFRAFGLVSPGTDRVIPFVPLSTTRSNTVPARRISAGSEPGTIQPNVPGWVYGYPPNSNILLQGTYRVA